MKKFGKFFRKYGLGHILLLPLLEAHLDELNKNFAQMMREWAIAQVSLGNAYADRPVVNYINLMLHRKSLPQQCFPGVFIWRMP